MRTLRFGLLAFGLTAAAARAATDIVVPPSMGGSSASQGNLPASSLLNVKRPESNAKAGAEPGFALSVMHRRNSGIDDYRGRLMSADASVTVPSGGDLTIARTEIGASILAMQQDDFSSRLGVMVPINSASSSAPDMPGGSEFGGYALSLTNRFGNDYLLRFSFADHRSDTLHLVASNYEVGAGAYLQVREAVGQGNSMAILAGPEVAYPYTRDSDAYISYGLQWGARLKAEVALDGDSVGAFRLNLEALMRRVGAYSVSGESQGGAGLFTAMPSIEYNVWNDFWIGFAAEIPIFRPKDGREMAFNDIGLPGLFGNSFGVTFRITAL